MAGFQQLEVQRKLIFSGDGNNKQNVKGDIQMKKVYFHDHFLCDGAEHDWVAEGTNGGTIAHAAANGGTMTLVCDGGNDDCAEFSHIAQWSGAKNCVMEARIKLSAITAIAVNVGWVDADMSADDEICFELTGTALTNAKVTDGAAFVFDVDGTTDVWYCAAVDSDVEGTPVTFSTDATTEPSTSYANFRVALDTSGNATFTYNGDPVAYLPACITAAALLTPYVSVIARAGAAKTVTIDRITCWQDE